MSGQKVGVVVSALSERQQCFEETHRQYVKFVGLPFGRIVVVVHHIPAFIIRDPSLHSTGYTGQSRLGRNLDLNAGVNHLPKLFGATGDRQGLAYAHSTKVAL